MLLMNNEDGTFLKKLICAFGEHSGDIRMPSDLQLVYMVPKNSIQLLNINTTKSQVACELVQ